MSAGRHRRFGKEIIGHGYALVTQVIAEIGGHFTIDVLQIVAALREILAEEDPYAQRSDDTRDHRRREQGPTDGRTAHERQRPHRLHHRDPHERNAAGSCGRCQIAACTMTMTPRVGMMRVPEYQYCAKPATNPAAPKVHHWRRCTPI